MTHDDPKQISETQQFKQLVKNIDFERFKTLEQENIERETIKRENIERENIELKELLIRLTTIQIDEQKTIIEERETIDDIPTRTEKTRSEPISTSKCKNYESKVKSDPDPPPSDSSDDSLSSSDSRRRRKKIIRKIIRKRRRKQ